jgi:chromosome segregation ATPase
MSNELTLSSDLNVITAEINSYKQVAGQAIFEIGRRLKEVRDNPKLYGFNGYNDWENWCNKTLDITRNYANRYIKVVEELGDTYHQNLGVQSLYLISTLPEEERNKPHTVPSTGEQKTVDEMTVKELREVKQALKQAEDDKKRLAQLLTEERNKPVKVETRTVHTEVIPDDVKKKLTEYDLLKQQQERSKSQLDNLNRLLQETIKDKAQVESQLTELNSSDNKEKREVDQLKLKEEKLKHEAHVSIFELQIKIQEFIKNTAPSLFLQGAIAYGDVLVKKELTESVKALEEFTDKLKDILQFDIKGNYKSTNNTIIDMEVI